MPSATPLTLHQQELINVVKAAHDTLMVARRTKQAEINRRIQEAKIKAARDWDETEQRIRMELDREIVAHEEVEDMALIAAFNDGIPINRIAIDGFGNRLPGAVHAKLRSLRSNDMIGSPKDYQLRDPDEERIVEFPKPVDVSGILADSMEISEPTFTLLPMRLELVPGEPEWDVLQVRLDIDPRYPYLKEIAKNARPGTPYRYATYCTLYKHPGTGDLMVMESNETGDFYWDHPVARWVKDHPEQAQIGFNNATTE